MNDDIYLNLAVDLYNNGTWDKETLIRKVTLYAQEKNMDMTAIKTFLDRLTKVREYTIEDKKKILSVIKLGESELKYGDVINSMSDEMVEKFFSSEEASLGHDTMQKYYETVNNTKEENKEIINKPVVNPTLEPKELTAKDIKINGNITLEDVMYGNYTADDLLGKTEKDSDTIFDSLVSNVDKNSFRLVVENLKGKLGLEYAKKFVEEWSEAHTSEISSAKEETKSKGFHTPEPISEPSKESSKVVVPPLAGFNPETTEEKKAFHAPDPIVPESSNEQERVVVPSLAELNMPETEEEYKKIEKNVTTPEKDSSVRKINISPERLAKLKKTKNKVLNFSIKTIMLVAALNLLNPIAAIGLVGGYMYFAEEIRCGKFNPSNPIGKAIKSTVEKIMYIGMGKDKKEELEKEGGKTR